MATRKLSEVVQEIKEVRDMLMKRRATVCEPILKNAYDTAIGVYESVLDALEKVDEL